MIEDIAGSLYIAKKDLKEYYLKPGTVSWGLVFPIAFTLAFLMKRGELSLWLVPGMISLAIFFGATSMSAMSIVFERKTGSFERLLLFPISYTGIALGKSLSSFFFGLISSIPVIILSYMLIHAPPSYPILLILCIVMATFLSSTFGVLVSFSVKDPSQTMTVFNLVRFPMMFLSGIIIPLTMFPEPTRIVSLLLPLTYLAEAIRYSYTGAYDLIPPYISIPVSIILSLVFLVATSILIRKSIP